MFDAVKDMLNYDLKIAVSNNDISGVQSCLSLGANANYSYEDPCLGTRFVIEDSIINGNYDIFSLFLYFGFDINQIGSKSSFPAALATAIRYGRKDMIKTLLDVKVDLSNAYEILEYTYQYGNAKIMQELIFAGIDVNAKWNGGNILVKFLPENDEDLKMARLLIDAGADVNSCDYYGKTPLSSVNSCDVLWGYEAPYRQLLLANGAKQTGVQRQKKNIVQDSSVSKKIENLETMNSDSFCLIVKNNLFENYPMEEWHSFISNNEAKFEKLVNSLPQDKNTQHHLTNFFHRYCNYMEKGKQDTAQNVCEK